MSTPKHMADMHEPDRNDPGSGDAGLGGSGLGGADWGDADWGGADSIGPDSIGPGVGAAEQQTPGWRASELPASPFVTASVMAGIRGLFTHMPALRKGMFITLALAIVGTSGRLIVPVVIQRVSGFITATPVNTQAALMVLGIGAAYSVMASMCQVMAIRRLGARAEAGLAQARLTAFDLVHRFSLAQQTMSPRGQLISRLTSDLDDISAYLQSGLINLGLSLLQMVVVAVVMVIWAWPLAVIVAVCTVIYAVIAVRIQVQIAPAFTQARENAGRMQAVLAETIMGTEVIQAFNIAERTQARMVDAIEETRRVETKGGQLSSLYSLITLWYQAIVAVLSIVASVVLVAYGYIDIGVALAFPFLVALFTDPMMWFGESLTGAQMTLASWRRVCGLLDTAVAIPDPATGTDALHLGDGPLDIRLDNVAMMYPNSDHPALEVPALHIPARQQVAVVGETGSGKTTLSKLITRLIEPTQGQLRIGGVPVGQIGEAELRAKVTMVPQDDALMASSLRANLCLARPHATDDELIGAIDELQLRPWLDQLPHGLDTELGERGANLSAGQRQLVGLLRAHLAAPQILVLDEATSALDPATERLVRSAMAALVADRTTITIAHRLSTAAEADRILLIHDGHIIEDGTHHELLAIPNGHYQALWNDWERGTQ